MPEVCINIKANAIIDNKNGTFTILLPGQELSEADSKTLERLYPNLGEAAFRLLSQEALLASLATASEINAPKTEKQESEYADNEKSWKKSKV